MNLIAPQISIILPFYNAEKYIDDTLKSLMDQSFKNFELLAVNDNSTDKSPIIVKNWARKDNRIKMIMNSGPKGLVGALNTGLSKAKSKYIARADADDIYLPDRLKDQFQYMETHPNIALLGTGYSLYDGKRVIGKIIHPQNSVVIAWNFLTDTFFCHPSVMFRRNTASKIGLYKDTAAEDFKYFSNFVHNFETSNLKKIEILYRIHENNLSKLNNLKIVESVKETFNENFAYYFGNTKNMEVFYNFRRNNILELRDFIKIIELEIALLSKIKKNYNKNVPIQLYFKIMIKITYSLLKTIICKQ